jgi:heme A synthase
MSSYYFLFACAYWVSVEDLKEKSAPQEYAFIFVSVIDLLLFVSVTGAINLYMDRNILSGITVIIVSTVIASINYFVFLRGRRFQDITDKFARVSHTDFKRK